MANRFPLILDTTDNQLKEIQEGDNLELTGSSIIGVQNVSVTGYVDAQDVRIDGTSITTSIDYNNLLNKPLFSSVAFSGVYSDLNELPVIPADVSELTDDFDLLGGSFLNLSDTPDDYIGRAGQFLRVNVSETGLELATVSTSGITDQDVIDALGYTPYDNANPDGYISGFTGQDVKDALGYNPYDGLGNPLLFINDSAGIVSALGYTPYNADTNTEGYISDALGITDALGYTPYNGATNPSGFLTSISESDVTGALGYTPYNGDANALGFINDSAGITDALGYTPYNGATNPSGFLTSISESDVTGALGYTPYNGATNTLGFINDSAGITNALGYTPYDAGTNSAGFLTSISQEQVTTALGYTPYNNSNPDNFIALTAISGTGDINFNQITGVISFTNGSGFLTTITDTLIIDALGYTPYNGTANTEGFINDSSGIIGALGYTPYNGSTNPSGFLTAEADTLQTVTTRGPSTTASVTVGSLSSGTISGTGLTLTGGIEFGTGSIVVDGGTGSSIRFGGISTVTLGGPSAITVQTGIVPNNNNSYDLGTTSSRYANVYAGQGLYFGTTLSSNAALATMSASSGSINITTAATGRTHVTTGTFRIPNLNDTQKGNISSPNDGDMIYAINRVTPQVYFGGQWRDMFPQAGAQPASPWFGMIAVADGSAWNPKGNGDEALMCYLNDTWVTVA